MQLNDILLHLVSACALVLLVYQLYVAIHYSPEHRVRIIVAAALLIIGLTVVGYAIFKHWILALELAITLTLLYQYLFAPIPIAISSDAEMFMSYTGNKLAAKKKSVRERITSLARKHGVTPNSTESFQNTAAASSSSGVDSTAKLTDDFGFGYTHEHDEEYGYNVNIQEQQHAELDNAGVKETTSSDKAESDGGDGDEYALDLSQTLKNLYDKLTPEEVKGLAKDTQELIDLQKSLLNGITSMVPALADGRKILKTFESVFSTPIPSVETPSAVLNKLGALISPAN